MPHPSSSDLTNQLLSRFGPTIGGQDLYLSLGFKTYAAFHRSQQRETLGVNVFKLPGRRGWFALTGDVATWLEKQSTTQGWKWGIVEMQKGKHMEP